MFNGKIVPDVEFILDLQSRYLTIRDIVRVRYITSDGRHVMVQPKDQNVLIRLHEDDFRVHAKQRIPYSPVTQDKGEDA